MTVRFKAKHTHNTIHKLNDRLKDTNISRTNYSFTFFVVVEKKLLTVKSIN